jgi:hypothetical protein
MIDDLVVGSVITQEHLDELKQRKKIDKENDYLYWDQVRRKQMLFGNMKMYFLLRNIRYDKNGVPNENDLDNIGLEEYHNSHEAIWKWFDRFAKYSVQIEREWYKEDLEELERMCNVVDDWEYDRKYPMDLQV